MRAGSAGAAPAAATAVSACVYHSSVPGFGAMCSSAARALRVNPGFAIVAILSVLSVALFGAVELIERLNDEETLAVIAHEVGHIHAEHVLYITAARLLEALANVAIAAAPMGIPGWPELACCTASMASARIAFAITLRSTVSAMIFRREKTLHGTAAKSLSVKRSGFAAH